MTNVYKRPEKLSMKTQLFEIAVRSLEKGGWKVERVHGSGKSSVRRITRGAESKIVSIRTTQDTWIAFPRVEGDKGWRTLDEVDAVVPVSVDDPHNPKFAKVHLIGGDEMRDRFQPGLCRPQESGAHDFSWAGCMGVAISSGSARPREPYRGGSGFEIPADRHCSADSRVDSRREGNERRGAR